MCLPREVGLPRGVSAWMGGCLPRGVSVREGVCPGDVSVQGGCLPMGVSAWGWQTPDPPVDRQTPVKTKPSETSFAGGKKL